MHRTKEATNLERFIVSLKKMNSSLRLFPSALVAARAFSTKAVSHAPPKKIHGIPGRYAGAVYTAASKVN